MAMQTCNYLPFPSWDYDFKNSGTFYEFQDSSVAVHEIPDLAVLPQSSLDLSGLEWSCTELSSSVSPVSTLEGHNLHVSPAFQSPTPLQSPSGAFSSVDCYWRDKADLNQRALGDALKTNDQLSVSLNKKHEEILALQERNNQLKELASQAKHLASILDLLTQSTSSDFPTTEATNQRTGIKRQRQDDLQTLSAVPRANINNRNLDLHRDSKQPKLHQDVEPAVEERINVCGAFRRLQVNTFCNPVSADSSCSEEGMYFRTSIRDHCTIRTLVFPQGRTFTSKVHSGGYRFRWVPC
ncbi:multicilin [Anguilla rostrata]|uniref:multicilin n=1 Tax=Anguilla rostrata TaxID=7938 RepID=UPI0030D27C71